MQGALQENLAQRQRWPCTQQKDKTIVDGYEGPVVIDICYVRAGRVLKGWGWLLRLTSRITGKGLGQGPEIAHNAAQSHRVGLCSMFTESAGCTFNSHNHSQSSCWRNWKSSTLKRHNRLSRVTKDSPFTLHCLPSKHCIRLGLPVTQELNMLIFRMDLMLGLIRSLITMTGLRIRMHT